MILTLNTSSKSFRYTFTLSLLAFSTIIFSAVSYSWTGPSTTPPGNNVAAPVNVGTASQVKSGALSVNGLSVYGNQYISGYLGIGSTPSAPWRIYAPGSQYGIYAEATDGQAIRGYASSGYGGYFVGYGGVFAQNSGGYYAFLGYPGTYWSLYANGPTYTANYSRADGGFCIGGSCKTSWNSMGSSYWTGWVSTTSGTGVANTCSAGYVMTGMEIQSYPIELGPGGEQGYSSANYVAQRILCTSLAP